MIIEDFTIRTVFDVGVIKLNMVRATVKETSQFKEKFDQLINAGFKKIVVDLSDVSYVDTSIIGIMVINTKSLREIGGDVRLVASFDGILNLFAGAGIKRLCSLYNSEDDAVNSFNTEVNKNSL